MLNEIVGGKWWKIDFHLHTPASYDYGHSNQTQKHITPKKFLLSCMGKKLDCVVITDHNVFDWIPKLQQALEELRNANDEEFRDIVIFPGIEINVQGGVHLLGIFDPSSNFEDLKSIFARAEYDKNSQATRRPLHEVMNIIIENNGIAIPSHVDKERGLFCISSDIKRAAFNVQGLLAFEMINPECHDQEYVESKLKLSHVLGSDSHDIETIADKFTWVKMGEANIEALRLALHDNEGAILRSDAINSNLNPNDMKSSTYLKSLTIEDGRYIGRGNWSPYTVQFSPFLNAFIGGRGSGKSTLLNFLRLIFDRGEELPKILQDEFQNFRHIHQTRDDIGMLEFNTRIFVEMIIDGVEYRLKWENDEIQEFDDVSKTYLPVDDKRNMLKRFPIHIFSQKQLYEMTKDVSTLFRYVDSLWDFESWQTELSKEQENYKELCQQLVILQKGQIEYNRLQQNLNDVSKKLKIFENDTTKKILDENDLISKQTQFVQDIYKKYQDLLDCIVKLNSTELLIDLADVSPLDSTTANRFVMWRNQFHHLQDTIKGLIPNYPMVFMSINELLDYLGINERHIQNAEKMNQVLNELKNAGIDNVNKYAELIEEQRKLQLKISSLKSLENTIKAKQEEIDKKFGLIHELIKKRYEARESVIRKLNDSNGALEIRLKPFGDLKQNAYLLRDILRKSTGFDSDIFEDDTPLDAQNTIISRISSPENTATIQDFIDNLKNEKLHLIKMNTTDYYSKKFIRFLKTLIEEVKINLFVWIPEDSLELKIKVGNEFKSIDTGSHGQRTSAMLSLILNTSNVPIIIDQPEDDLDTRNITNLVVKSLNEIKNHTQIIVATHNPNIVVNANAEWIVNLDFKNGQIQNVHYGALQDHAIRDAICEVMEGGKDALEKRYYRIFKALNG